MKKRVLTVLLALALLCSAGGAALASSGAREADLTYRGVTVKLNGTTLVPVDANGAGVEPFILDGTTYLPLRAVAGALGLDVGWDDAASTVSLQSGGAAKTGSGEPLSSNRTVHATLNYRDIKITLDGAALVPADASGAGVEPFILDGTTYLPLRAVANALGLTVGWDNATSTVTLQSGGADSNGPSTGGTTPSTGGGTAPSAGGVSYRTGSVSTSAGTVSAHVLTVDPRDPAVNITPGVTGGVLCTRDTLASIAAAAGNPLAVITANFMSGDDEGNYPVGNLMINGELVFTGGGITSIGIKEDGGLICGRPGIRVRVMPEDGVWPLWNASAVNVPEREIAGNLSALYTPAKGASFTAEPGGTIMTVSGGAVSSYGPVAAGTVVPIPADGFVLIMTDEFMSYVNNSYRAAVPGEKVHLEYYINGTDPDGGFASLDGVKHIFSGGPRLVKNGAICTELEEQFSGERFTTISSTRTCAGYTADGKLILVSSAGTIQAMRELMLALGCVEAINLDGGASTALYYNGQTLVPEGRLLAYTLRIYNGG